MNKPQKNWFEWIVFALGLILVSSTLGYLIFAGASMGHEPPSLEVRLGTPEQRQACSGDAQRLCPETGEPLGSMGTPIKVMVKEQPVFICCKACEKGVLADPDATLKKVEELKARFKAAR